jgi:hypothetical protein
MAQSFRFQFSLFCDNVVFHVVISVSKQPAVSILNCALNTEVTGCVYVGVLISSYLTRNETSYSGQTRDLFNILPTKLNTLLSPLL